MCAQFMLKAKVKELEKVFGFKFPINAVDWSERVVPYKKTPTVTAKGFRNMNFSLVPSWSKEKKAKFATHNARIETIVEKPTWKKPFETKRCLVPLTTFIEPIYENKLAGNMVGFHTPDEKILVAAGIYDEWVDKITGEVFESFAILTTNSTPFITETGHDRSPVFIKEDAFQKWIDAKPQKADYLLSFLKEAQLKPSLEVEVDRPLKAGWEKRR